jgi:2-hydroxy-3-oxopropionate reductase
MSTITPAAAVRVAGALSEKGMRCLDAPVSGGDVGAQQGTLSIMVGGEPADFQEVKPIFDVLGKSAVLCGPNGAGQTVKACNQVLVAVTIAGVSEALVLGAKAGVDPAKIVQVLSGGLARCGVLENRGQRMVQGDFEPGFRIRLHYKDLNIVRQTSKDYGVPLPTTAAVHELFTTAMSQDRQELDHSGLLTVIEDLAGIEARTAE